MAERRLWSHEESVDRAFLASRLAGLALEAAVVLMTISRDVHLDHPAAAEWLRQVGERVGEEARAYARIMADGTGKISGAEFAHRIEALIELSRRPAEQAVAAVPQTQHRLGEIMDHVWSLAHQLNGRAE